MCPKEKCWQNVTWNLRQIGAKRKILCEKLLFSSCQCNLQSLKDSAFTVFTEVYSVQKFWQGEDMFWLLIMRHLFKKERVRGKQGGRRHAPSCFNLACRAPFDITPWSTICWFKMRGYFHDVERREASLEKKGGRKLWNKQQEHSQPSLSNLSILSPWKLNSVFIFFPLLSLSLVLLILSWFAGVALSVLFLLFLFLLLEESPI